MNINMISPFKFPSVSSSSSNCFPQLFWLQRQGRTSTNWSNARPGKSETDNKQLGNTLISASTSKSHWSSSLHVAWFWNTKTLFSTSQRSINMSELSKFGQWRLRFRFVFLWQRNWLDEKLSWVDQHQHTGPISEVESTMEAFSFS